MFNVVPLSRPGGVSACGSSGAKLCETPVGPPLSGPVAHEYRTVAMHSGQPPSIPALAVLGQAWYAVVFYGEIGLLDQENSGVLKQGRPITSCHKIRAQRPLVDFATAVLQDSEFLTGEDASGAGGAIEVTVVDYIARLSTARRLPRSTNQSAPSQGYDTGFAHGRNTRKLKQPRQDRMLHAAPYTDKPGYAMRSSDREYKFVCASPLFINVEPVHSNKNVPLSRRMTTRLIKTLPWSWRRFR